LSGFSLSLLWRDVADDRAEPLTIKVSFNKGNQLSFRHFLHGKTVLVGEFGFQRSLAAFNGRNFIFWIVSSDQNGGLGQDVDQAFGMAIVWTAIESSARI
jgi:DNA-binding transcriptional MocR family regulator